MKSSTRTATIAALAAGVLAFTAGCASSSGDVAASGGDPVSIGFIAPLKGSNAVAAKAMVNAAELAIAEVNAGGGINGRNVELKIYDDELSPDVASRVATRAITVDEVPVLVGGLSSAEGLAIREVAERSEVPYLASASSAAGITKDAKFTFRVAATALDQANAVVDIANALGLKNAAIMFDNGAVGPALSGMFQSRAKETGLASGGSPVEYVLAGTDLSGPVKSAAAQKPDVLLVGGSTGADHGLLAKTMVEQGLLVPIIGLAGVGFPDAFSVGGGAYDQLPGAYFPSSVDMNKPRFKEFHAAYEAKYGKAQLADAAVQSYDAVRIAAEGLRATNGTGGKALNDAISAMKPLDGAAGRSGSTISFGESRDGLRGSFLVVYRSAKNANSIASDVTIGK
ncbi:ABC transporter substrate-binding protein [Pseudarthrobacter sp. NIBRBAC000502772]|uniref:ABC transporter substrate-binding protein n=1 Tax=Pseudarthrobacter sp. NIBRBAC000502772 TaxID=2590775 RepID=UPI00143DBDF9|nr:ABC transporter substrate-binding protein [Pseudarthrobacter sp. NIBRBAC000502772]